MKIHWASIESIHLHIVPYHCGRHRFDGELVLILKLHYHHIIERLGYWSSTWILQRIDKQSLHLSLYGYQSHCLRLAGGRLCSLALNVNKWKVDDCLPFNYLEPFLLVSSTTWLKPPFPIDLSAGGVGVLVEYEDMDL